MLSNVWDKATYPFPNVNGATSIIAPLKFGNGRKFHPTLYNGWNYLSMLALKWERFSERGPWMPRSRACNWLLVSIAKWFHCTVQSAMVYRDFLLVPFRLFLKPNRYIRLHYVQYIQRIMHIDHTLLFFCCGLASLNLHIFSVSSLVLA